MASNVARYTAAFILVGLSVATDVTVAVTTNWNTNSNGSYTNAANWSAGVPGSADTAVFNRNLNIEYGVTFPGRPIASPLVREAKQVKIGTNAVSFSDSLNLNQLPASFKVDAGNTLPEDALIVGDTAGQVATLSTTLADLSTSTATIGNAAGSSGTLNVGGGTLSVALPEQAATYEFYVGKNGTGALNVTNGGQLIVAGRSRLASAASSVATVTVSGPGSTWQSAEIRNGFGSSTISVQAGGSLVSQEVYTSNMNLTVTGNGSSLISNKLSSYGTVTISNGAIAEVDDFSGGRNTLIDGTGSLLRVNDSFEVSNYNVPTEIRNSGWIHALGTAQLGHRNAGGSDSHVDGTLTIDGAGSHITANSVNVGFNQTPFANPDPHLARGYLNLTNGGFVAGSVNVRETGTLIGTGTVSGNVTSLGTLKPTSLQVDGNVTQGEDALLRIEIAGTTPGSEYGRLIVGGTIQLRGTLEIVRVGGFVPQPGDTFDILDFSNLTTPFPGVTLNLQSLPAPFKWDTRRLYTDGILKAILPGDYDESGTVDTADYVVWRKRLISNPSETLPNDGTLGVGFDDYSTWRANFGNSSGSGAGALDNDAVPEPTSCMLLCAVFGAAYAGGACARVSKIQHGRNIAVCCSPQSGAGM